MEFKVGDKFKVKQGNLLLMITYTITEIKTEGNKISIIWDCVGKKNWYKRVSPEGIENWISEGRLVKIN